jgi:2-methylisocitrate lyase-like PEP mutase family enzyme
MRCVREFEAAGIAGIHIEDQAIPSVPPTTRVWSTSSPCRNLWSV